MANYVSVVCSKELRTVPHNPDRILYNKVPKCGSRTISRILKIAGRLNDHRVSEQTPHNGILLNDTKKVKVASA